MVSPRSATLALLSFVITLAASASQLNAPAPSSPVLAEKPGQAEPLGSGDGRIHVIPTLSAPSVKNGETLTIQAVVKAQARSPASRRASVEARTAPTPPRSQRSSYAPRLLPLVG